MATVIDRSGRDPDPRAMRWWSVWLSRVPLYARVLIGVVLGVVLGVVFRHEPWIFGRSNADLGPLGMLVVRLLKTLATPLIFLAIVDAFLQTAVSARAGARLLLVCLINVSVAMTIGLLILNLWGPGYQWAGKLEELGLAVAGKAPAPVSATLDPLKNLAGFIPESVIDPFSKNLVISVVFLAIITGVALRQVREQAPGPGFDALAALVDTLTKTASAALMLVAGWMPLAVMLIVADVVGKAGIGIFSVLGVFLVSILAGLLIHTLVWYPLFSWVVGRMSPIRFFRGGLDAIVTAVSCNSSLATMPVTLRCLKAMGVRDSAARLSACVGTNFNNDGIMLYEATATLFLCQALGYDLGFSLQVTVVLASVMAGVGIAGVPEAGLVILPLVLAAAGVPEAAVAVAIPLIVPVDWIIARVRSGVNVTADLAVAVVLDRFEEEPDQRVESAGA